MLHLVKSSAYLLDVPTARVCLAKKRKNRPKKKKKQTAAQTCSLIFATLHYNFADCTQPREKMTPSSHLQAFGWQCLNPEDLPRTSMLRTSLWTLTPSFSSSVATFLLHHNSSRSRLVCELMHSHLTCSTPNANKSLKVLLYHKYHKKSS